MRTPGINGEGELRGQPDVTQVHLEKWPLRRAGDKDGKAVVADSLEVTSIGRISVLQCLPVEHSGVGRGKHSQGLSVDGNNLLYQVSLSTGAGLSRSCLM